jgi:O-antigen/teichoic acid export membrane protein
MSATILKKLPVFLEQSVFSGTGFLINIALVKLLDLEQYGLYASLVLGMYFLLGVSQALVVQPMQVHIGKAEKKSSYCLFLFFLKLSLILCFSIIIIVVSLADFKFLKSCQVYLLPFTAYMASFLGFDFYRKYFLATGQVKTALVIGLIYAVTTVGVFGFVLWAQSLLGLVNILLQTIENYVLPQLSRAYQISLQHCYRAFQSSLGIYQLSVLAGLSLLFLFAEDVLRLAGNASFVPYAYVLRGMVVLYAIIIIAYPIRLLIRVTELNKSYFSAYLVSFLFSLFSYQFLLSHFGVSGAIIGLIINQLILQATWLLVLNKNQFNVWKLYI